MICLGGTLIGANGCAGNIASNAALNPFCVVGPPPPELIPAPGAPHGWIDDFLAVFEETCDA